MKDFSPRGMSPDIINRVSQMQARYEGRAARQVTVIDRLLERERKVTVLCQDVSTTDGDAAVELADKVLEVLRGGNNA